MKLLTMIKSMNLSYVSWETIGGSSSGHRRHQRIGSKCGVVLWLNLRLLKVAHSIGVKRFIFWQGDGTDTQSFPGSYLVIPIESI